jgi:membrane dipeptidase
MNASPESMDDRIARVHGAGMIDLHFDLPMFLCDHRNRDNVLTDDFLSEFEAGDIGTVAASIYIEDQYVPESALEVALAQVARTYVEVERCHRFAICRSFAEIKRAREQGKIGLLIAMEGAEPLGAALNLLRIFYELGLRILGLTHVRSNAAGHGGIFAASGSSPEGLTAFGCELVRECERLGVILDLAHINPAGFDDILENTTRPVIVSHTNARKYYDIERNISDEQIKAIGARGGVIGVNSILVSSKKQEATLDHYVDHIQHVIDLIGIDGVGIGFDFFEFFYRRWSEEERAAFHKKFPHVHFIPDLLHHGHARNVTAKLIEHEFSDEQIEKILFRNWMRIFETLL